MAFTTEQETFWAGAFGDDYIGRNVASELITSNMAMFDRILANTSGVSSVLEVGPNVGMNLRALRELLPSASLSGVEINSNACAELRAWGEVEVHEGSVLEWTPSLAYDLVFTKGVLIHLNPGQLSRIYDKLEAASARYILVAEYYSPMPVEVPYRGHQGRLFKRDFAGEIMDRHPGLSLVDYGFAYRHDPLFPQDDLTWFLLEKAN